MTNLKIDIQKIIKDAKVKVDFLLLAKQGKLPMRPTGWNILIEPVEPPRKSAGGIEYVEQTRDIASIQTNCARVLALGPTAFEGKTSSGIELSKLSDEIKTPGDMVGRWIIYQKHTGQASILRRPLEGKKLMNITASEILDLVDDPNDFLFWV